MTKVTYTLRETDNEGFVLDANSGFPGQMGTLFAFTNAADLVKHIMKEYDVSARDAVGPERNNPWHFVEENEAFRPKLAGHTIKVIWRGNGVETHPQEAETFSSNWPLVAAYQIVDIGKPVVPPAPPMHQPPGFPQQPAPARK